MKNLLLLGLLAVLAFCGRPDKSEARPVSVTAAAPGACPQSTDNGCAAAPANGSFQSASLLTSAQQSGQNSLLPTRAGGSLTLNIPGVDYGIGPNKTLTPRDPRTINDGVCQYSGSPKFAVLCHVTSNGQVVHEVLDNYDFCGSKIGQSSVGLYAYNNPNTPGAGTTLKVTNSYFCLLASGAWPGIGVNTHWALTAWNNQFDGSTAKTSSAFPLAVDTDALGDTQDIRYNVFIKLGVGRVAGGLTNSGFTFRYNYVRGLNNLATGNHGELMLRNCSPPGRNNCAPPSDDYEGNFIVWDPPPASGLNNGTLFPGDGSSDGIKYTSFTAKDNIIVTNKSVNGKVINQALFTSRVSSLGTVTITGNWVDASGADDCSINGVKAGGSAVTASQTGNTLNITGLSGSFGNNPIEPGYLVLHSGYTTSSITAYRTGGGNIGTYTVNGPSQNIASDSNWTVVPGYSGTPTLAPNWNLVGSGAPVAMGLNGPQFLATHCSPYY